VSCRAQTQPLKVVVPIGVDREPEVLFQNLVDLLDLSVRFWVEGCAEVKLYTPELGEDTPES